MKNILAIFKKQIKDTTKNKTVLIQFVLFPVMTIIMNKAIKIDGLPENFLEILFCTMYIGMTPLTSIASIISEEKEQNTLRVLLMSNVKPHEFLIGIGSYVWLTCMLGSAVMCFSATFDFVARLSFMLIAAIGITISLLVGAAIGTFSKTQMMATSIATPAMMVSSLLPLFSMFNDTISKVARFFYSEQIRLLFENINDLKFNLSNTIIIAANILIAIVVFAVSYKKSELG